jgi:serine/threonine protein kinase
MLADETVRIQRDVKRIDKYPIVGHIGQGAMGQVWLARHPDLDIPVAIKPRHPIANATPPRLVTPKILLCSLGSVPASSGRASQRQQAQ